MVHLGSVEALGRPWGVGPRVQALQFRLFRFGLKIQSGGVHSPP